MVNIIKKSLPLSILSSIMMFFQFTGYSLAENQTILWSADYLIKTIFFSILSGLLLGNLILFVFYKGNLQKPSLQDRPPREGLRRFFFLYWIPIFLCWLPAFLAFYPGLCNYDFPIQMQQILTSSYNSHHPLAHTLILGAFYRLGTQILSNVTLGIALYTLFQMLILSFSMAFSCLTAQIMGLKRTWRIVLILFYCFFPFHAYLAISISKDVLFTSFFLIQICSLFLILDGKAYFKKRSVNYILFAFSSILMILFRNNGMYALLVMLVAQFIFLIFQKEQTAKKITVRLFFVTLLSFALSLILLSGLSRSLDAQEGDKREMLSVPMQQIARILFLHEDEISSEDLTTANSLFESQGYRNYIPQISDPVKQYFVSYTVKNHFKETAKLYYDLISAYPGEAVNAVLALDAGYLYLGDLTHGNIYSYDYVEGYAYIQIGEDQAYISSLGIQNQPILNGLHDLMTEFAINNLFMLIPLLHYLFTPAFWFWWTLFTGLLLFYRKRLNYLIPWTLMSGYLLTCLLGPCVQLRYIYPVIAILPFFYLVSRRSETFSTLSDKVVLKD